MYIKIQTYILYLEENSFYNFFKHLFVQIIKDYYTTLSISFIFNFSSFPFLMDLISLFKLF